MDVQRYFDDHPIGFFGPKRFRVTDIDGDEALNNHQRAKETLGGLVVPFQVVNDLRIKMRFLGIPLPSMNCTNAAVYDYNWRNRMALGEALFLSQRRGDTNGVRHWLNGLISIRMKLLGRGAVPSNIHLDDLSIGNGQLMFHDLGGVTFDPNVSIGSEIADEVDMILRRYSNRPGAAGLYRDFGGHGGMNKFDPEAAYALIGTDRDSARPVPDPQL